MDIREIDDRYPEFAEAKNKKSKKHSYSKLSTSSTVVKAFAITLVGAVAIDAGSTAITNEINGTDEPNFFKKAEAVLITEEVKLEPEITDLTASYLKKKVTVSFNVLPNDLESVDSVTVIFNGNEYSASLDENYHSECEIEASIPEGEYTVDVRVNYTLKKEKEITASTSFEKPPMQVAEISDFSLEYTDDTVYATGSLLENDSDIKKVYVEFSGGDIEFTTTDNENYTGSLPIYLENGDYTATMYVEYEMDGEEGTLEKEATLTVELIEPTFTASYKLYDESQFVINGKYEDNDGKVTSIYLAMSYNEYEFDGDGNATVVGHTSKYTEEVVWKNGKYEYTLECSPEDFYSFTINMKYTFRGQTKTVSKKIKLG